MKYKVSVIIPTYNRVERLHEVIHSYINQENVSELIIINDGSSEDYSFIITKIRELCNNKGIKFIYKELNQRCGAPAARNIGIGLATWDFFLFSDDDIILGEDCIKIFIDKTIKYNADIIGGRLIWIREGESCESALERFNKMKGNILNLKILEGNFGIDCKKDIEIPFVGIPFLWKRNLFDKGVRFYTEYKGNGYREETDPQIEVVKAGGKIIFTPDIICWHLPHSKKGGQWRKGILWKEFWTIYCNWIFLRRHSNFFKEQYGITPLYSQFLFCWHRFFRIKNL